MARSSAIGAYLFLIATASLGRSAMAWCDPDVKCDWSYDADVFSEANSTFPDSEKWKFASGVFLLARDESGDENSSPAALRSPEYAGVGNTNCRLVIKARLSSASSMSTYLLHNGSDVRSVPVTRLASKEPPWDFFYVNIGFLTNRFQIVVLLSLVGNDSFAGVKQIFFEGCVNGIEGASCDFEKDMCSWTRLTTNRASFDWQRASGAKRPKNVFPAADHTYSNSSGYYIFVSPRNTSLGHRADLLGPVLSAPATAQCKMSFWYYIGGFGDFPSNLHVYHTDMDSNVGRDIANYDKSSGWTEAVVSIPSGGKRYRIMLTVRPGMKNGGVLAIDDLQFSPWCFEGPQVLQHQATAQGTYQFSTCGSFGRGGPTPSNCNAAYKSMGSNVVLGTANDVPTGLQVWTVPVTDTYVLIAAGALGGLGADVAQQQTAESQALKYSISATLGESVSAYANLTRGDVLYIGIGQAGKPACQAATGKPSPFESQLVCSDSKDGGGGGGGGATFVFLQPKDSSNVELLMVAAGGGGLGQNFLPVDLNLTAAYSCGPTTSACNTELQLKPGNGRFALPENKDLPITWPKGLWKVDLTGSWGCSRRSRGATPEGTAAVWNTAAGGFGGGGGGCKAGGGGGGYPGGLTSLTNDPRVPGQTGASYVNSALAQLTNVEKRERYSMSLDGSFKLYRKPPPCPCEDVCSWLDVNFTSYSCLCSGESWILAADGRSCKPASAAAVPPVVGTVIQDGGGGRGLSLLEIALIGVSAAAATLTIAGLIACGSIKRHWRTKRKNGMRTLINDPTLTSLQHPPEALVNSLNPNLLYEFPCFTNFGNLPQISRDNLLLVKALGQGAFGEVFEGILSLDDRWDSKSISVAVKTSSAVLSPEQAEVDFLMEALIVSKFNHPNIVTFLGVCWDSSPRYIVLELLAGGDLRSYLREQRPTEEQQTSKLTIGDMLKLSLDIACACHHLEQNHFIHRDIAARNCLLTEKGPGRVAKIADFGMARDIYRADYYRKGGRALLPVKWMPPEAFLDGVFTTKTDVWSYGVLLWEIFSMGYMPYPGISNREVVEFVMRGRRMEPPSHAPSSMQNLMKMCWLQQADKRPSFASTVQVLERCLEDASLLSRHIASQDLAPCSSDGKAAAQDLAPVASPILRHDSTIRFSGTTDSSEDCDSEMLEAIDSPGATSCEPLLMAHLLFDGYQPAASPASNA